MPRTVSSVSLGLFCQAFIKSKILFNELSLVGLNWRMQILQTLPQKERIFALRADIPRRGVRPPPPGTDRAVSPGLAGRKVKFIYVCKLGPARQDQQNSAKERQSKIEGQVSSLQRRPIPLLFSWETNIQRLVVSHSSSPMICLLERPCFKILGINIEISKFPRQSPFYSNCSQIFNICNIRSIIHFVTFHIIYSVTQIFFNQNHQT